MIGATGAIGTALIEQCINHGAEVLAVCHRGSKRMGGLPKSDLVKTVFCNLDEVRRLPELVGERDYDVCFFLAWDGTFGNSRDNMERQLENVRYTLDAVYAADAMGCGRFVGAGSQAEYGRSEGKLRADTPTFPESGYGMAKLCAGQMSRALCGQLGMAHVWCRVLSVYGPCDNDYTMVTSVIRQLLQGREPALSKGEQLWDYLYAKDAGKAFYFLGERGVSGKVYPLGSGECRPLREYAKMIRDCVDPALPLGIGRLPYGPKQVMYLCADISELKKDTGFEAEYSFEEGIRQTIAWCQRE